MTISSRLYAASGAAIGLTFVLGAAAWICISDLGNQVTGNVADARQASEARQIQIMTADMLSDERAMLLRAFLKESAELAKYEEQVRGEAARRQELIREFEAGAATAEEHHAAADLEARYDGRLAAHNEFAQDCGRGDTGAAAQFLRDRILPMALSANAAAQSLADAAAQRLNESSRSAQAVAGASRWIIVALLAVSIALAPVVLFIVRHINQSLRQSIVELSEGSDQVSSASAQVSSASQSLAQGSSEQAASIEETSASSEEIRSMAQKNTDNSHSMAKIVSQSQENFAQANRELDDMIRSMSEINQSSDKISKIIRVIDEIAFQTNILALNAAVEAARAGEAGMGFAVVADEVRSLAQRSAQAAKDTAILIEDSIARSSEGRIRVDQVATAIRTITADSQQVKILADEVTLGSEEQSRGLEQIARAISQMEQVTQTTAANAEEGAAAAEELSAQAQTLKDVALRLRSMVGGLDGDGSRKAGMKSARRLTSARSGAALSLPPEVASRARNVRRLPGIRDEKQSIPLDAEFHAL